MASAPKSHRQHHRRSQSRIRWSVSLSTTGKWVVQGRHALFIDFYQQIIRLPLRRPTGGYGSCSGRGGVRCPGPGRFLRRTARTRRSRVGEHQLWRTHAVEGKLQYIAHRCPQRMRIKSFLLGTEADRTPLCAAPSRGCDDIADVRKVSDLLARLNEKIDDFSSAAMPRKRPIRAAMRRTRGAVAARRRLKRTWRHLMAVPHAPRRKRTARFVEIAEAAA